MGLPHSRNATLSSPKKLYFPCQMEWNTQAPENKNNNKNTAKEQIKG